jgi:hypothetical protein
MTTVNTTTTPTGTLGTLPTPATTSSNTALGRLLHTRIIQRAYPAPAVDPLARQQAIENALSMALYLIRTSDTPESLQRATGRAIRAASMLKQACSDATTQGRA